MIFYRRKIINTEFKPIIGDITDTRLASPNTNNDTTVSPLSIQVYLTQNIEDIGIYDDVEGDYHDTPLETLIIR